MKINYHYSSPNYNNRPTGENGRVRQIILHYTDTDDLKASLDILLSKECKVSAHYIIDVDGQVYELVSPDMRAWHAGISCWDNVENVNDYSIGIEIQNPGHKILQTADKLVHYPKIQIDALLLLLKHLCDKYDINSSAVIGHSDIAPERKLDPGEHFPWDVLGENGFGIWPKPEVNFDNILLLQYQLKNLGYNIPTHGTMDEQTWSVIDSFKRHFYPKLL
jgi:N-acetylmuramoyl-L-alanine amidase